MVKAILIAIARELKMFIALLVVMVPIGVIVTLLIYAMWTFLPEWLCWVINIVFILICIFGESVTCAVKKHKDSSHG